MLLLGLDTATLTLSAALVERSAEGEDRLIDKLSAPPPAQHSALLPRAVEEMLARAGRKPGDLSGVVVGLGPGSFTGLRISLATAKGLCYAASVPLAGASSLEAMAKQASADCREGALLVPCLDARKGEVYAGFYRKEGSALAPVAAEAALAPQALLERIAGEPDTVVFGIGREAYPALAGLPPPVTAVRTPDAQALIGLVRSLPAFSKEAVFSLEPRYVRPPDSEWTLRQKQRP